MEQLERTHTNAATDSKGRAFGLSGNLFFYPIAGMVAALIIMTLCFSAFKLSLPVAILLGLPFAILPILYVALFRHNKPRGFDRDWIDSQWASGFSLVRANQPPNPRYRIASDD